VTGAPAILLGSAVAVASLMLATWGVSLAVRDASIVDVTWGAGFVLVAWVARWLGGSDAPHAWLLPVLATLWGLRLTAHLARRNLGKGEDFRYVAMRERHGDRFAIVSLGTVFGLQGALMWVVSLPLQLGQRTTDAGIGPLALLGVLVWALGLAFEAIGDRQLARFRADPAHAGRVLDTGLWAWTRHPNYFGDACVWWGLALVAADTGRAWIGLLGALVMNVLLVRVSGAAMLERSLRRTKPGWADYAARTPRFVPRPPRRAR
jgi:steroid 5-alpha reductase family enzyme